MGGCCVSFLFLLCFFWFVLCFFCCCLLKIINEIGINVFIGYHDNDEDEDKEEQDNNDKRTMKINCIAIVYISSIMYTKHMQLTFY